ncbi:MAG TPA: hypothetical protein VIJ67_11180 [Pseudolabrys sp.]|jgi:hypothetical protein
MTKLFIDIVRAEQRHLDFSGRMYSCLEEAGEAAQLMCMDLGVTEDSPWVGAEVQVKDVAGRCLFTYPVGQLQ